MPAKKSPRVSIVIPCYNLGQYLEEAVKSVKDQTYRDWELIIVDDGSNDSTTRPTVKKVEQENPGFTVIYQENAGLSEARNGGIQESRGEFVVCLDADDMLHTDFLSKTVPVLEADARKRLGFVTTYLQEFGERNDVWETSEFDIPKILLTNVVHAGSLFRKEAWEKAGGYKKAMKDGYEDWEFWLSIIEKGFRWTLVPQPLFRYRIRANSMLTGARSKHLMLYERLYDFHEKLFAQYQKDLVLGSSKVIQELRHEITEKSKAAGYYDAQMAEKDRRLAEKEGQIAEYKPKAERLDDLQQSRITRYALQLVRVSVFLRKKIPAAKVKIRRKVKALIPRTVKLAIRRLGSLLFPKKIVIVENPAWHKDKPLVTIVTPFFNNGSTILDTAKSVLSQTYRNIEYIIVDDGSDKGHAQALDSIRDGRVTLIHHKENIGKGSPAAARNEGIRRASGKYIVCLDADDMIDPTYVEKCVVVLETSPWLGLVTTNTQAFGSQDGAWQYPAYNPKELIVNNMVTTAAMFRRAAWEQVGGYKAGIGYEDWEYWINLAEHGFFGKSLPENLFRYRTATSSRYTEDKKKHNENIANIRGLHPKYKKTINKLLRANRSIQYTVDAWTAYRNLDNKDEYQQPEVKPHVLIAIPWMTFGGAETLIYNFCKEVKDEFGISFVTGLPAQHEWEYKFKEISTNVFHLPYLYEKEEQYLDFVSNYIRTRDVSILHIIHTSYVFGMLPEIKRRHPQLEVIVTVFNDRAHFNESVAASAEISAFSTDNSAVAKRYTQRLREVGVKSPVHVIPNGIDSNDVFNPQIYDREKQRLSMGLSKGDLAVVFFGRLSPEKNPDVFLQVARTLIREKKQSKIKFFVIGDGVMREEVEKTVADINSSQVQYLGYQTEVARFLSAADVFVLPSSIEGFPLSVLEAMAMEVAVIASDVGAVSDVLSAGIDGFIVRPGSATDITKAIESLKDDQKLLASVKTEARKKVEARYSNTILGDKYKKLYNDVLVAARENNV